MVRHNKKQKKALLRYLCVIYIFTFLIISNLAEAKRASSSNESQQKETAVDTIWVAPITIPDLQKSIASELLRKGNWEVKLLNTGQSPTGTFSSILQSQVKGNVLKMELVRFPSGRKLQKWNFPIEKTNNFVNEITKQIIQDLPYRGFVTKSEKSTGEVRINIGRDQQLKAGAELTAFELESATFNSEKESLAKLKVIRTGESAAIARVIDGNRDLPIYSKVDVPQASILSYPGAEQKNFDSMWLSIGAAMNYLDTKPTSTSAKLKQRVYQLTLSPFAYLAAGYDRFSFEGSFGQASNASNSVSFMYAQTGYEINQKASGRFGLSTTLGLGYQRYQVSQKASAALPLVSNTSYWPYLEQMASYSFSPRSRLWVAGQIQIPKMSQDSLNGSAQLAGSFGVKTNLGLRLFFTESFGVENSVHYQYSQYSYGNEGLLEALFGVGIRSIYLF